MCVSLTDRVLVVVQLTGGNDFMNTVIPYTNPAYYDARKKIVVAEDEAIPINDNLAFHPSMGPIKDLYDQGHVAVVQGIGYPNSSRSHFRAMDIWHTCEPNEISTKGWLGQVIKELDPKQENVLTGVNFGRGLPRAMASPGVPVSSVGDLENYGLMSSIVEEELRLEALEVFKNLYAPAIGTGPVMEYLSQTGRDVIKGADTLKIAPSVYSSSIEYGNSDISKSLQDVARVHLANLGVRIFYTQQGGYDTHANEISDHPRLLSDLSGALMDFIQDLREHKSSEEVAILVFTEFGRRIKDNGSGTDHGSGGGAFIIGDNVKGGLYSEYPSLAQKDWEQGEDLKHTIDFRSIYASILEQWFGVQSEPIVGGNFEQISPFES